MRHILERARLTRLVSFVIGYRHHQTRRSSQAFSVRIKIRQGETYLCRATKKCPNVNVPALASCSKHLEFGAPIVTEPYLLKCLPPWENDLVLTRQSLRAMIWIACLSWIEVPLDESCGTWIFRRLAKFWLLDFEFLIPDRVYCSLEITAISLFSIKY